MEEIKEFVEYDSETGVFTWIKQSGKKSKIGKVAGTRGTLGYIYLTINKKRYLAHRAAWFLTTGEIPTVIDHINGIRDDNRIINLRNGSYIDNNRNIHIPNSNSTTGIRGVCKEGNKYKAYIMRNGKRYRLGNYKTIEEAARARKLAVDLLDSVIL